VTEMHSQTTDCHIKSASPAGRVSCRARCPLICLAIRLFGGSPVRSAFLLILGFLFCVSATPASADKRVALVIGMSQYQQVPRLVNPARDAAAMTELFKKAGFNVIESKRDLGISDLRRVIREFSDTSRDADIAVVYYAGHGIEVDGTNYLVPADARLVSDFDVEDETISLDRVLKALDPVKRLKLVILDACRDNPFAKSMKRSVASRSIGRGLAKIEPQMSDTLIAFAAKAGAVASDGDGQNSPFATALVKYIAEPGLDLRLAFGRVRDDVLKSTSNRQEPFVYGSLGGETMALVPQVEKPVVPQVEKPVDPQAQARIDYELAAQIGTKEVWDSFIASHNTGFYANLARAQNDKLMAAQRTSTKADDARRDAEEQAAQKAADLRKQLEEQSARQTAEAKQKLSEQAKKDMEEARRQVAEQAKKELDDAKHQVELAQQQAEAARRQVEEAKRQAIADAQLQVEQAKRDAKQEAEELASLTPPTQPLPQNAPPPSAPQIDPADIARLLQAHLKRVGCNPGTVDGNWDDGSKKALGLFNKNAQTQFDIKLASLDALDAVRGRSDRVCPLICAKGQRVDGDRCIEISCGSGFFLNSSGSCEKRPEPKARTAVRQEPAAAAPRRSGGGGGGKCFSFNGKSYCE
jgi:uncharacterized caspase-like protein